MRRILVVGVALGIEHDIVDGDDETANTTVSSVTIDLVFEESFEELYSRAYGVAYQLVGRRSEAEDVAQETLARAFVRWRSVRPYAEAWVVRVAGNLAIDGWRRVRRIDHSADAETASVAVSVEPTPYRVDLQRALHKLSRRQRDVLILRFLADLPEADVARALGCSAGSVKQHASRGLAALRKSLGPFEGAP
ncbi:MAG TPA: SigE family RNA polymerase sigma factor [Acidimicrobiia bacterium]